jgi:hypothetical protein
MNIVTNNQPRNILHRDEVPKKVLEKEFSHLSEETDGFFKYKRVYYHCSDFFYVGQKTELVGWDGYFPDSYFTGIVIKKSKDDEIIVGTYLNL